MIRRFFIAACIAAVSLLAGCASFTGTIPIESDAPEAFYISPKNADGIKDSLAIALDFPEIKGLTISSYEYSIQQDDGSSFYSYSERAERPPWYKRIIGAKAAVKTAPGNCLGRSGRHGRFCPGREILHAYTCGRYKRQPGRSRAFYGHRGRYPPRRYM